MMLKEGATQVAGMHDVILKVIQAATEKFVVALRDALPKLDLMSTSRKGGGKKNVVRNVCSRVWAIFRATCVTTKLQKELSCVAKMVH